MNIFQRLFIACVRIYQFLLSPDHNRIGYVRYGVGCRFYPSCSEYSVQAVRQYGLLRGSIVSLRRVLRCHPFSQGGFDPLA